MPMALREVLADHKARAAATGPRDPVFVNRNGRRETVSNLGRRLKTVLRRVDVRLTELQLEPIGQEITPYSFRRLYGSLRYALGDDPVYVAEQMGMPTLGGYR
jgi:integrase